MFLFIEQDSFELDLEDAIQPPRISISAPDLAFLEFTNLQSFPLRRSVSSTELLYERAMARFYEAVELEESKKAEKVSRNSPEVVLPSSNNAAANTTATVVRKRLASMTEAERLSFEKRSELRRQSADIISDLKTHPNKWGSKENMTTMRSFSKTINMLRQESQESADYSDFHTKSAPEPNESYDLGSDYTDSTEEGSEEDSIEKFKQELMARTRSPSPRDLETYHPRDMSAGVFTPYRVPTPESAAVVLTRPSPLPSPDFVPKPILKRPSSENMPQNMEATGNAPKLDVAKGIKSFFKRDKRSTTEKNTEENQLLSKPIEKSKTEVQKDELEAKRKLKEEEDRKKAEAQRLALEEAHAAVDHYSDLVRQVSVTHKYHTPLYLDREELKKAAEKAEKEGIYEDSNDLAKRRSQSPEFEGLRPLVSNKPRLSISERGQMVHVRETASDLALIRQQVTKPPSETPSEDNVPINTNINIMQQSLAHDQLQSQPTEMESADDGIITTTVVSETLEERPDSRGRTRLVKVKRIVKKRVSSSTRSRDASSSRPPSSLGGNNAQNAASIDVSAVKKALHRSATSEAVIRHSLYDKPQESNSNEALAVAEIKTTEQICEEAHENVRSAFSYTTDLVLFVVACYVYLFKDARLVLPILALMIYRQLGEVISAYIPNWMKRKKN